MTSGPALENLTAAIGEACRSGRPPEELRDEVLPRLNRAVPFDAAFWATTDPGTLLFTQAHQQALPHETIPAFLANESEFCPTRQPALAGVEQALSRVALLLARESERVVAPLDLTVVGRPQRASGAGATRRSLARAKGGARRLGSSHDLARRGA
jgi:hypothetical protein